MAFSDLFNYRASAKMQDSVVDKTGVLVECYEPLVQDMSGYENIVNKGVLKYKICKLIVDWKVSRGTFYRMNWFPEDADGLLMGFFTMEVGQSIPINSFIRTSVVEQVAPYGDIILKVVKIWEEGKHKVLRRTHFLRLISDKQTIDLIESQRDERE